MTPRAGPAPRRRGPGHGLAPALVLLALALALAAPPAAAAPSRTDIKRMVVQEALNTRVPAALALAVAKVESDFGPKALSSKGARGVMQVMPRTADGEFGVAAGELWEPRLNIQLGLDFLERLIDRYQGRWDLALSHYNAGRVAGVAPDAEVLPVARKYVDAVLRWEHRYSDQARVWEFMRGAGGGSRPARAPLARAGEETAETRPGTVVVQWTPAAVVRTAAPVAVVVRAAAPAARGAWSSGDARSFDDARDDSFEDVEARRLRLRESLDDFASNVIWTDG